MPKKIIRKAPAHHRSSGATGGPRRNSSDWKHHRAKLTVNQVRRIKQLLARGTHPKKIVEDLDLKVGVNTIVAIKHQRTWKRVQPWTEED